MARYDCFTFFNELDLLEIRLRELERVIDVFVVAEAPWTFQGQPKPLYFDENRKRFAPWLSRIRHVVDDVQAPAYDQWSREYRQRNALHRGFADADAGDFVMISDVDEVVRAEAVLEAERLGEFCFVDQAMYLYFLDWRAGPWRKVYGGPASEIRQIANLSEPRRLECAYRPRAPIISNGGWHFSWMGGVERMVEKLGSFSHTEDQVQQWRDSAKLQAALDNRAFFFDSTPLTGVGLGELPSFVQESAVQLESIGLISPGRAGRSSRQ